MNKLLSYHSLTKYCMIWLFTAAICGFLPIGNAFAANERQGGSKNGKILVAFFSHSGNTSYMAEQIHAHVGGDMLEIKTVNPYPRDYDAVVDQAKREQKANYRPQLATGVSDLKYYNIVFIGYPNWWGTMPMAMFTFLEKNNFSGKTIIPFSTHEGSRFGRSITDLKALAPQSTILEGLAIRGRSVKNKTTQKDIATWLTKLNMSRATRTR